jgi:ankyrin repeat protein
MAHLYDQFIDEIENNNIEQVNKLLNEGADIHYNNDLPLMISSYRGYYEMTKFLLDNGANINATYRYNCPIIYACLNDHIHILELLLERGANIENNDIINDNIINSCFIKDSIESLKLLIKHGFTFDTYIQNAFTKSVKYKSKNILQFILDNYSQNILNKNIFVGQKNIKKYRFIRMLVDREIIDLPD